MIYSCIFALQCLLNANYYYRHHVFVCVRQMDASKMEKLSVWGFIIIIDSFLCGISKFTYGRSTSSIFHFSLNMREQLWADFSYQVIISIIAWMYAIFLISINYIIKLTNKSTNFIFLNLNFKYFNQKRSNKFNKNSYFAGKFADFHRISNLCRFDVEILRVLASPTRNILLKTINRHFPGSL